METLGKTQINFIFRKQNPDRQSIEELFGSIIKYLREKNVEVVIEEMPKDGASPRSIFKNCLATFRLNSDINHVTGDVQYTAWASRAPTILTIHDIKSTVRGHFFKKLALKFFWVWLPAVFSRKITVISEFSKTELCNIVPFAKNKIEVIYNPVNKDIKFIPRVFNSQKPRILHLGTKKNKNLERTIKALSGIECQLVIIGKLKDNQKLLLNEHNIDFLNYYNLKYQDIIQHYVVCDMVSFPSTYEGFGMPIIEAQKTGRPVITSNVASMPEVAGEGALLIDPYKIEDIRNGYLKIISDENYRKTLVESGLNNVKRFEINKIAKQYIKVYNELVPKIPSKHC